MKVSFFLHFAYSETGTGRWSELPQATRQVSESTGNRVCIYWVVIECCLLGHGYIALVWNSFAVACQLVGWMLFFQSAIGECSEISWVLTRHGGLWSHIYSCGRNSHVLGDFIGPLSLRPPNSRSASIFAYKLKAVWCGIYSNGPQGVLQECLFLPEPVWEQMDLISPWQLKEECLGVFPSAGDLI